MANVEDRIYDLTAQATPYDADVLIIDNSTNVEPHQITYANLIAPEETARDLADTAIKDGAGLETDGTLIAIPGSNYLENADFVAAAYLVNLKNGLHLLDTAIGAIAQAASLWVQHNLTSAEILDLNVTPLTKQSACATGKFYLVKRVIAKNNFNSVAYTSAGANGIYLRYTGAADYIAHLNKTFLERKTTIRKSFEQADGYTIATATGLQYYAPDGNPTNGDGTISVIIEYVLTNDFFGTSTGADTGCCVMPISGTFVAGDLTASGNLEVNHALNTSDVAVFVLDNNNESVAASFSLGDEGGVDKPNNVTISIGARITGTWRYYILGNVL